VLNSGSLQDWEILVLCKLKWDLSAVTATDFIDLLLHRLSLPSSDILHSIRKYSMLNLSNCLTGEFNAAVCHDFTNFPPKEKLFNQKVSCFLCMGK